MKWRTDREVWLEAGFVLFGLGLLGGLGMLLLGRAKGKAQHHERRAQGAPAPGSVSDQRHRNIATVAAR